MEQFSSCPAAVDDTRTFLLRFKNKLYFLCNHKYLVKSGRPTKALKNGAGKKDFTKFLFELHFCFSDIWNLTKKNSLPYKNGYHLHVSLFSELLKICSFLVLFPFLVAFIVHFIVILGSECKNERKKSLAKPSSKGMFLEKKN